MQSLAEELKREDLQKLKEKGDGIEAEEVDEDWEKCMSTVMGLDENIEDIIRKAYRDGRLSYYTGQGLNKFTVYFNSMFGYDVMFVAYEYAKGTNKGDFKYAHYVAFNNSANEAFMYKLVGDVAAEDVEDIFNSD